MAGESITQMLLHVTQSSSVADWPQMSSRLQLDVRSLSLGMRHLVNAYEVEAGTV